jgi:hypothetical protein
MTSDELSDVMASLESADKTRYRAKKGRGQ